MTVHAGKAEAFFRQHIRNDALTALYSQYGFPVTGSVSPQQWELFAAILLDTPHAGGNGQPDLVGVEVKSAGSRHGFEYQYHRENWAAKLTSDATASHLFITYTAGYDTVSVRQVPAGRLAPIFESWQADAAANYANSSAQRFRKSISLATVLREGELIFEVTA